MIKSKKKSYIEKSKAGSGEKSSFSALLFHLG